MKYFLEQNKDFVLKLKIKATDGETRIRRVCLPRIANADGTSVSYEELIGLAIVFTFPEEDPKTRNTGKYTVSLTYYDDEKDLITLGSTEELVDAIELFAGLKSMRITTCVKPKISYSDSSTSAECAHDAPPSTSTRGRSDGGEHPPDPPVSMILESFAGILTKLANDLPEVLATHFPPRSDNKNEDPSPSVPTNVEKCADETKATSFDSFNKKPPPKPKPKPKSSGMTKLRHFKVTKARKGKDGSKAPPFRDTVVSSPKTKSRAQGANESSSEDNSLHLKKEGHSGSKGNAKAPPFRDTVDSSHKTKSRGQGANESSSKDASLHLKKEDRSGSEGNSNEPKENTAAEQPFVHGRHTCDGCLTTPIVGKRYRATNLPDYDLCQYCFHNYKGSEIEFKPVELGRDSGFQTHWNRRYQQNVMAMKRRSLYGPRHSRSRGEIHIQGRPGFGVRGRSQPKFERNPLPHPVSVDSSAGHNRDGTNLDLPGQKVGGSNDFDTLLKEAIRRSLDDIVPKENPSITKNDEGDKVEKNVPQEPSECTEEESDVEDQGSRNGSSAAKGDIPCSVELVEREGIEEEPTIYCPSITKSNEGDEIENNIPQETSKGTKEASATEDQGSTNVNSAAKSDIPCSVEIVEHETNEEEHVTCDESTLDTSSEFDEFKMTKTMEQEMDTDSVDSEKLLLEAGERDCLPSPVAKTTTNDNFETPFSTQSRLDDSFASDAIGSGDVAEAMGKTLDMVAGAISDMLSEYDDPKPNPIENSKEMDLETKMGELVVNSNDETEEKADDDEDDADWSVVKSVGTNGTTESQKIGQAVQMLGSALLSSSSLSMPSSVPTVIGSINSHVSSPPQVTRWANELEVLQDLGFDNEEKCIEILERIDDLSDPRPESNRITANISIVVNELLELNDE